MLRHMVAHNNVEKPTTSGLLPILNSLVFHIGITSHIFSGQRDRILGGFRTGLSCLLTSSESKFKYIARYPTYLFLARVCFSQCCISGANRSNIFFLREAKYALPTFHVKHWSIFERRETVQQSGLASFGEVQ